MDLLNERRRLGWSRKAMVAEGLHDPIGAAPGKADRRKPGLTRRFQGRDYVRRAARGGYRDEHIARLPQPAHLPLEGTIEPIIVTDRGENRTVGG